MGAKLDETLTSENTQGSTNFNKTEKDDINSQKKDNSNSMIQDLKSEATSLKSKHVEKIWFIDFGLYI